VRVRSSSENWVGVPTMVTLVMPAAEEVLTNSFG